MAGGSHPGAIRTFLIADIRGYTAFTQARGDEAAARLTARFAQIIRETVEDHSGQLLELRGDEALCVFDSPRGALRSGVAAQRRFADEMRADPSMPEGCIYSIRGMTSRFPYSPSACPEPEDELRRRPDAPGEWRHLGQPDS